MESAEVPTAGEFPDETELFSIPNRSKCRLPNGRRTGVLIPTAVPGLERVFVGLRFQNAAANIPPQATETVRIPLEEGPEENLPVSLCVEKRWPSARSSCRSSR